MKVLDQARDIFIATHVLTYGPAQALRDYLIKQKKRFVFLGCPFEDAKQKAAEVVFYEDGQETGRIQGHGHKRGGIGLWLKDGLFVFKWGRKLLKKKPVFIGVNNLNAAIGIWLKRLGFCSRVIYYVIDYTPVRFKNRMINRIYQGIVRFALKNSDAVWNLSERMKEVHINNFGADRKQQQIVPVGIDYTFLKPVDEKEIKPGHLVMISTLYENKGIQLAIEALQKMDNVTLTIVGEGPYEQALKKIIAGKQLEDRVTFITEFTREELFYQIAISRVAIATYVPDESNYTYYADPSKPKEYLACGTPMVITRVPWIADAVEQHTMGVAIDYNVDQLVAGCKKLIEDDVFWKTCRTNALKFVAHCDYPTIYTQAFNEFEKIYIQDK